MPTDGSRRKMLLPMLAVLALAIVWSGYWVLAISSGKRIAAAKRAELQQQGLSLACREETWGGYPFRFEFHCEAPVLVLARGVKVASSSMRAVTMAYNPWHVLILIAGPTTLDMPTLGQTSVQHGRAV